MSTNYMLILNIAFFIVVLLLIDFLLRAQRLNNRQFSDREVWKDYRRRLYLLITLGIILLVLIASKTHYEEPLMGFLVSPLLSEILFGVLVLLTAFIIILFVTRLIRGIPAPTGRSGASNWQYWASYMKGQGVVLFAVLVLGALFAAVSSYYGPLLGQVVTDGDLHEYRQLKITDMPVATEYIGVEKYSHLTVYTKVITPTNSSAIVSFYGIRKGDLGVDVKRIESGDTWSRWDQESQYSSIRVIAEQPPEEPKPAKTKQVDVLIYVSP